MPRLWTDAELLEGIARQCEDAACAFDQRFRKPLVTFARKRGLCHDDADDLVQEVLIAAIQQIQEARFQARSTLHSWLISILLHRSVDAWRRDQRRKGLMVSMQREDGLSTEHGGCQPANAEIRLQVREALLLLPPRERLVLVLNRRQGLTAREIAPALGLGAKTTEGILTRARKLFHDAILGSEETGHLGRLKK